MKKKQAKHRRQNRTIVVDVHDEATYADVRGQGKAFIDVVVAFILSIGFQLTHDSRCSGGGALTRHSHYARVRLGGLTIWRLQWTECKAVFPVLPHFVLRYRGIRAERAKDALLATHGGAEFGTVCHDLPRLANGHLSPGLCRGPPEPRGGPDPLWVAPASVCSGR
jgi:hypothetical protein